VDSLFDADAADEAPTLTVGELSARIHRLTARAFPADVWVSGQIRNLNRSNAGHVYFDLAEPAPAGAPPRTQLPVTLLAPEREHVNRQLVRAGGAVRMEDGIEVRVCGRVRWYAPRGVLQFRMHGIDPAFTLGRLQADRDRLLRLLAADGLLDANAARPVPLVPLRVGLVTSRGSAAEADVRHELARSGFAFEISFVDARTQGLDCGPSVVRALARLADDDVDVVLLARGGGARTDLAGFDGEDVARAVAAMPVPVFTGIGHEVDRSIADEVAAAAHKTPTAAAAAVVERVRAYLDRLDATWAQARRAALATTATASGRLDRRWERVARAADRSLDRSSGRVDELAHRVGRGAGTCLARAEARVRERATTVAPRAGRALDRAAARLALVEARIAVHDPAAALARGWSLTTTVDGRTVRDPAEVDAGTTLVTRVAHGTIHSTVTATATDPAPPAGPDRPDGQTEPTPLAATDRPGGSP